MLKPEIVPSEAIRKAMREFGLCMDNDVPLEEAWERIIAAAINAWRGMGLENREVLNFGNNIDGPVVSAKRVPFIILPLITQENENG